MIAVTVAAFLTTGFVVWCACIGLADARQSRAMEPLRPRLVVRDDGFTKG